MTLNTEQIARLRYRCMTDHAFFIEICRECADTTELLPRLFPETFTKGDPTLKRPREPLAS
jgi:hypothetical protein